MGEIADAMLSGLFCEGCAALIDGEEPGYPRYCSAACAPDGVLVEESDEDFDDEFDLEFEVASLQYLVEAAKRCDDLSPAAVALVASVEAALAAFDASASEGGPEPRAARSESDD